MGAHQPVPHPSFGFGLFEILPIDDDRAGIARQHSGQQIDERGLAGTIRPDQTDARATRQIEIDLLRHRQRTEILAQTTDFEDRIGFAHER